jgi:hypothetical protein
MFKLFQSMFRPGADRLGAYPEDLITRAIGRAIDGTDPRLRAVTGHRKRLRPAVIHAIDHVVRLVDSLPPPLGMSRRDYGADAELRTYFASADHMNEVLSRDAELRQWQKTRDGALAERVLGLLIMEPRERNVLGMALEGDQLRHDVAQVTVGFNKHRVVDPTAVEDDTRRLLKRRAFEHLLTLALVRFADIQGERADLEKERSLMRGKLAALRAGGWGFGDGEGGEADEASAGPRALQQRIREIDAQLGALGTGLLESHLDILVDVLARAEENLRPERMSLCVDRQGVKQAHPSDMAPEITLTTLHNSTGRSVVVRLVRIERADLPPPPDFLGEARRFLG